MAKHHFIFFIVLCATSLEAEAIKWIAVSSNNSLNEPSNWSSNSVPGSSDIAIFDSSLKGVVKNPEELSSAFVVQEINFPHLAAPFAFSFSNQPLQFSGLGITGAKINPYITIVNTDNQIYLLDLCNFTGSSASIGSAIIEIQNNNSLIGTSSGQFLGLIDTNLYALAPFTIDNGARITLQNSSSDSSSGVLGNSVGHINFYQFGVDNTLTIKNDVELEIVNVANYGGANSAVSNHIGSIGSSQFFALQSLEVGDDFDGQIVNVGYDTSTGSGSNYIASLQGVQCNLLSTATFGENTTIVIGNLGFSSAQTTNYGNFLSYLNDYQLYAKEFLQAKNGFDLSVINYGLDASSGNGGNIIAVINSDSGFTGDQVRLLKGADLGENSAITVINNGMCGASGVNSPSTTAVMNGGQFIVGDELNIGMYNFLVQDGFSLNISNSANSEAIGRGGDTIGNVSNCQARFFTPVLLKNDAEILIQNTALNTSDGSDLYSNIGSIGNGQLVFNANFIAEDDCSFTVTNQASCSVSGHGLNYVGHITQGKQVYFQNGVELGQNNRFTITNSGNNNSSAAIGNIVGSLYNSGSQFRVDGSLTAAADFGITITNVGIESSSVAGNYAACILNNTLGFTASQLHVNGETTLGNGANIHVSNEGSLQSSSGTNLVAGLERTQVAFVGNTTIADNANFYIANSGLVSTSGQNNNSVSVLGANSGQLYFGNSCSLGKDATILITNNATNNDASGTNNLVGYITGSQMEVVGNFLSGPSLNLQISNSEVNALDDGINLVGIIEGSQLKFHQNCLLEEGANIYVSNTGTIDSESIYFMQGFDIASGRAKIEHNNQGTLNSYGIHIEGNNEGGNAEIALSNSSLYIESSPLYFTVGGLSSDTSSTAQSLPILIINIDEDIENTFNGSIIDFSGEHATSITKTGLGTQVLSGTNTYTGLTIVEQGTLVVNGSVAAGILVEPDGVVKGSGTILSTLTNQGQIAPGQSIGTITLTSFVNDGGDYEAEVNGSGNSDLILVENTATIDGGKVIVSSVDNGFVFYSPYTILTAANVYGTFDSAVSSAFIKPFLTYDANQVYLTIYSDLMKVATSCNQKSVAYNLDNLRDLSSDQANLISAIASMPAHDAKQALESLSGFQYTNETWSTQIAVDRFIRRLYDPLRGYVTGCENRDTDDWKGWIEGEINFTELNGSNAHTSHLTSYNLTTGIQKEIIKNFFLGLAGSYEYEYQKFRDASANLNAGYAGLYSLYRPETFYVLADLAYGYAQADVDRTILPKNLGYSAGANAVTQSAAFYAEAGLDYEVGYCLIQPFLGAQVAYNYRSAIHENHQDQFGLKLHSFDWLPVSSRLGLHASICNIVDFFDGSLDVAWNQMYTSSKNSTKGRFYDFGESFCVCGNKIDKTSIDYALTLSKNVSDCIEWYAQFEGQWWEHALTNGFVLGLSGSF